MNGGGAVLVLLSGLPVVRAGSIMGMCKAGPEGGVLEKKCVGSAFGDAFRGF